MLLLSGACYCVAFASQLRCAFVSHSDLRAVSHRLYIDPAMPRPMIDSLMIMITEAEARNRGFFGKLIARPVIIAGNTPEVIDRFGQKGNGTAVSHLYLGNAYIVLGPDGLNTDVLAHEMMHAELAARIGWLTRETSLPAWFDEGLAMQADHRPDFSEDAWRRETENGRNAPALVEMTSQSAFASERGWACFATAKHKLARWLGVVGEDGLHELLRRVGDGEPFDETYRAIEARGAGAGSR